MKAHVEAFQGWTIETRSVPAPLKAQGAAAVLQAAAAGQQEIDRSAMERVEEFKIQQEFAR